MAYTKHFPAGSAMISATYFEAGDRVRLVRFENLTAEQLEKAATRFEIPRVENPVAGMTGRITAIRDFHGDASYMVIHWDKTRCGMIFYPFIRKNADDVVELVAG